ncbi:hypothetical protein FH972_023433 [Carpinus fangiana]|uniref:t-SNARE coiled-coil homology domain-containing protein n=1 Tax=Carpinus fangiana TaxID=176857 RepID=A0A5N6KVI3_9ROSI|nr:hypothetical protein FH972_023433 [Carpinus fangiana]
MFGSNPRNGVSLPRYPKNSNATEEAMKDVRILRTNSAPPLVSEAKSRNGMHRHFNKVSGTFIYESYVFISKSKLQDHSLSLDGCPSGAKQVPITAFTDYVFWMALYLVSGQYSNGEYQNAGASAVLDECTGILDDISELNDSITRLESAHRSAILDASIGDATVNSLSASMIEQCNNLTARLKSVNQRPEAQSSTHSSQVGLCGRKLQAAYQRALQVESRYRRDIHKQLARQYRIVAPDATDDDVRRVCEDITHGQQIFRSAILRFDRRGEDSSVLINLTDRHRQIQVIEKQMQKLAELIFVLDRKTAIQEQPVRDIEINAGHTLDNVDRGAADLQRATQSAAAARRNKWICFWITSFMRKHRKCNGQEICREDYNEVHLEQSDHTIFLLSGGQRPVPIYILALPALFDILSTTLMNFGLTLITVSIYQMTRGIVVLFVCLFSVIFLKRHILLYKWIALLLVISGIFIVGLAGSLEESAMQHMGVSEKESIEDSLFEYVKRFSAKPSALTFFGVAIVAISQMLAAAQFVLEEMIMADYAITPLHLVCWEGTFGLVIIIFGQIVAQKLYGNTKAGSDNIFDARAGWEEIIHNPQLWISGLFVVMLTGFYNCFALGLTKSLNATSRSTVDTSRTLIIWIASLALGWESFKMLQLCGFIVMAYGTLAFNDVASIPMIPR